MKNAMTIFKKEFYRVMSDRRLIFTAILLPGLAIYVMYSFMGNAIGNEVEDIQEHTIILYQENMPDDITTLVNNSEYDIEIHDFNEMSFDDIKDRILQGQIDLLVRFPADFETSIENYETSEVPEVYTYYNPGEKYSSNAYGVFGGILRTYRNSVSLDRFGDDVYVFYTDLTNEDHVIMDEEKATGQGFASLMPMLIIMFLFSGAMSIGPDSIAGEKERGTIATLLVTPIKRSELAIGKVISLSLIALMSAASSFVGIMLSLPRLMQGQELDTNIYGLSEYLMLFGVLLATVLVIVGLVSMISAYAKSIKEASMLILPLYFVSIIVGVSTMFSGEASANLWVYLVPIYSSVNMLISVLTFEVVPLHFLLMVVSSVLYVGILIYIINKLFQSEKVMFSK
ncbi:ABC transporter permease [Candidatus Xianfuyuplasma coldseepsis]|uniref:ABC transporter permease n=1 Tax=Candidatus Xianfuyuplasma coldseepsis TaxID=2782163 RepID=A0A7L7KT01_9MOLU|nr:ABC transporter permease [Xianfuyuplasma coldseepsis]QMS85529.1 ABC transporter permease [Xianfuyuplasma coldseepsis]